MERGGAGIIPHMSFAPLPLHDLQFPFSAPLHDLLFDLHVMGRGGGMIIPHVFLFSGRDLQFPFHDTLYGVLIHLHVIGWVGWGNTRHVVSCSHKNYE